MPGLIGFMGEFTTGDAIRAELPECHGAGVTARWSRHISEGSKARRWTGMFCAGPVGTGLLSGFDVRPAY